MVQGMGSCINGLEQGYGMCVHTVNTLLAAGKRFWRPGTVQPISRWAMKRANNFEEI